MIKTADCTVKIQNIVATFSLSPSPLDLKKIHYAFEGESVWDEAVFNYGVVVLRVKEPKMSFLIYRTGKIICCGAKEVKDAKRSADYLIERFGNAGLTFEKKTEAKIQNIVATADLGTFDLEKIMDYVSRTKGFHMVYEPEQFPALMVKFSVAKDSEATVLLFNTGKLVCVGLKDYDSVCKAVELVVSKLSRTHV